MRAKVSAIIVAAGVGKRFGSNLPKQFLKLNNKTILQISLEKFQNCKLVDNIIVVVQKKYFSNTYQIVENAKLSKVIDVITGGKERQDSVWNGIRYLKDKNSKIILIHDAVRPLVSLELIEKIVKSAEKFGAAVPAIPLRDTIKVISGKYLSGTIKRDEIVAVQTPQGFKFSLIEKAYKKAFEDKFYGTDDASLVERINHKIKMVKGDYINIKITTAEDLEMVNLWYNRV